ncbi:uncharacterized protein PRCAT00003728001 [Priceomyces carsonii]|uniref:uncharacterized protein n=1 Tax=Priceomyces carsonii TaxID=28549 RepID=UPI002EDAD64D|nr:unnamed protein product [Priceomyces carsonii]
MINRKRSESCNQDFFEKSNQISIEETRSLPSKKNGNYDLKFLQSPLSHLSSSHAHENYSCEEIVFARGTSTKQKRNYFKRVVDSFKRCENHDSITGNSELGHEISGFSVQCIAIGGAVGTGLLIGSGKSLTAGPGSLLLAYLLISSFIYCMCQSLGELSVCMPIKGGFTNYSSKFVDRSWGFAMAWNYCFQWMILLPMELVAATMTFKFWPSVSAKISDITIISLFFIGIICMNLLSVKYYGFAEIVFALIKIAAIALFAILAVLVDCGVFGNPIGFSYWKDPGMFSPSGFYGFVNCVITAAFSFAGSELVGLAAAESKNPEKMIPKAIRQVFWRIGGFYMISLFVISLVVPYNHPSLVGSGDSNVNASPFVLALANIKNSSIFATIMNIVILASILSVGNSSIYASSRTLIALSENKQAPKVFGYIDRKRRPIIATITSMAFGLLAYVSVLWPRGSETMFLWLMSMSGISVILSYATICVCHLRFRMTLKHNKILVEKALQYRAQTGTLGSWYGVTLSLLVVAAQILVAIMQDGLGFSLEAFFQQTLGIFIILISYVGHKIYRYFKFKETSLLESIGKIDLEGTTFTTDYRIPDKTENCEKIIPPSTNQEP